MASQAYIGAIFMFAGNFAPRNYQLCQGQLLPISQNAALFSILGTTYGGNGTSTFGLPDLRCRMPVGQGNGPGLTPVVLGEIAGVQNATMTINNMPAHNHTCVATMNAANDGRSSSDNPSGSVLDGGAGINIYASASDGTKMAAGAITTQIGIAGGSIPFSVQNPFLGVNFIICTQGIFPSRN